MNNEQFSFSFSRVAWLALFVLGFGCPADTSAQIPWGPIVRIDASDGGTGTGFVVATSEGKAEIWTNSHVAGETGGRVRIQWGSEAGKITTEGFVATARYSPPRRNQTEIIDAAKIVTTVPDGIEVTSLDPCIGDSGGGCCDTAGWPEGRKLAGFPIVPRSVQTALGATFSPAPLPGQSGSPVTNSDGKVIGVVTYTIHPLPGTIGEPVGAFRPISDWTGIETEQEPVEMNAPPRYRFEETPKAYAKEAENRTDAG